MKGLRGGWGTAGALIVVLVLMLVPFRSSVGDLPYAEAAGTACHLLLWGGLAWGARRRWPGRFRAVWIWGGAVAVSGAMEILQSQTGRTADGGDWLAGALGAGWMCLGPARWTWRGAAILVLLPFLWVGALRWREVGDYPVLADPSTLWGRRNWVRNGVRVSTIFPGHYRVEPSPKTGAAGLSGYPGVFRRPAAPDWRSASGLATTIYWPGAAPAVFAVRVDDQPGNPSYADRFQREFTVTQGWNAVWIPSEEFRTTPGGRRLDLERVRRWGVFLVSADLFDYFLLGSVRLQPQEEQP